MNKGLALIAVVLSIVALLVTGRQLWGGEDDDTSRFANTDDQLRKQTADLKRLKEEKEAVEAQLQRIKGSLEKLEENIVL